MVRTVPTEACQPSQLLIDVEKLRDVLGWFDPEEPAYDPLPALPPDRFPLADDRAVDASLVLTDGHTRRSRPTAVATTRSGSSTTPTPGAWTARRTPAVSSGVSTPASRARRTSSAES